MWDAWFSKQLDESASHRIAQSKIRLEQFKPEHAERLLAAHLRHLFTEHQLPHALFPFTSKVVKTLCKDATSARVFLQAARARLKEWILFGNAPEEVSVLEPTTSLAELTTEKIAAIFDEFLETQGGKHFTEYSSGNPSEQALFGKLREVAECLMDSERDASPSEFDAGSRVLPFHQIIPTADADMQLVLAVCNTHATAFTARVNNLIKACKNRSVSTKIVLVRDARLNKFTPTMHTAVEHLRAAGHTFFEINQEAHSYLMATHDCLVAVEEGDLGMDGSLTFGIQHFRPYLKRRADSQGSPLAIFRSLYSPLADHGTDDQLVLKFGFDTREDWAHTLTT